MERLKAPKLPKWIWVLPVALIVLARPSLAADWGYEENKPEAPAEESPSKQAQIKAIGGAKSQKARPSKQSLPNQASQNISTQIMPASNLTEKTTKKVKSDLKIDAKLEAEAEEDWLQLYAFVAKQDLTDGQKSDIQKYLQNKIKSGAGDEVVSVVEFWPKVKAKADADSEDKENYSALLRALLRMQARKESELVVSKSQAGDVAKNPQAKWTIEPATVDSQDLKGADIAAEILGPERIAEPGSPALCEDAIDAYANMACFLYESKNPGKTVDATDNRTLFARVITYKFKKAPNPKDREAMANFDVTWSIFKIEWESADEGAREQMLERFGDTAGGASVKDPLLKLVLTKGPWKTNN